MTFSLASRFGPRAAAIAAFSGLIATLVLTPYPSAPAQAAIANPGGDFSLSAEGFLRIKTTSFEFDSVPDCSDGVNNDGAQDGASDFPSDPQCTTHEDDSEAASGFQPHQTIRLTGGTITDAGAVTFPASGVTFPTLYSYVDAPAPVNAFVVAVRFSPLADVTGHIDPDSGQMSLRLQLRLDVDGGPLAADCRITPIDINTLVTGTTAPPGPNTPIAGAPYNPETGQAGLVNNSFAVPGAQGCGTFALFVDLNDQINSDLGLPSAAGNNEAQLTAEFIGDRPLPVASNEPPEASDQIVQTTEDTPVGVSVVGVDPEGHPVTFTVESGPSHGTLSGTPPDLTYTPAADFHGDDSFVFKVTDPEGASDTGLVSIAVSSVNDEPVATNAAPTTDEDTPVTFTVSAADVDDAGLVYAVGTQPAHGAATIETDQLTYTPDADFSGTDSFTFSATDPHGASSTGTVTVTVHEAPNVSTAIAASTVQVPPKSSRREPTSFSATLTTPENVPLAGRVLTFTIGQRVVCADTTDPEGLASCLGTVRRADVKRIGTYAVDFAGDSDYSPSSTIASLVLSPR